MSLSDQRAAILEEKQEDFVSYTPLDRGILYIKCSKKKITLKPIYFWYILSNN